MKTLHKRKPSPALVISIISLVVALGGTSYAALSIPKNSVGTKQLRNGAVTNKKIKNGAVTTKKIKNGTVTANKINTSGLTVPNALHADTADTATTASTATTATTGGANVYYHNDVPTHTLGLTPINTLLTFQSLTLPAGIYLVTARHDVQRENTGGGEVDCYLYSGSTQVDSFYTVLETANVAETNASALPMVGTAVVTLNAPTTISDKCEGVTNPDALLASGAMWAIQVGSANPTASVSRGSLNPSQPASEQIARAAR